VPEGDTVLVAAGRLHAALAGELLVSTDVRVPSFATTDLSGDVLIEVVARGKHLLFRTSGGSTIHTHLRMDGRFDLRRPDEPPPARQHEIRLILETTPWVAVGRRLGTVEVLRTSGESTVVGHLGPDVLGADWDPDEALRRLHAQGARPIGEALIDQRVMAGPGNVYKSEALFLRGIDPWIPTDDVADLPALVEMVKRVMEANRATGAQVTTGDPRRGRSHWVYGRGGKPCRRCGTPIGRAEQGDVLSERVTYWCPSCQPKLPGSGRGPGGSPSAGASVGFSEPADRADR
jgi:endonuclease-8